MSRLKPADRPFRSVQGLRPDGGALGQAAANSFSYTDRRRWNLQGNDHRARATLALFTMSGDQAQGRQRLSPSSTPATIYPRQDRDRGDALFQLATYGRDYHQDNAYTDKVNPGYLNYFD